MERSLETPHLVTNSARCFVLAAGLAALAVAAGAYQAHGLQGFLEGSGLDPAAVSKRLSQFEVGVRYHFYHALALAAFAGLPAPFWNRPFQLAISLLAIGSVVFSGSLYLLVLFNLPVLGAITPLGGVMQIAGWLVAAIASSRLLVGHR